MKRPLTTPRIPRDKLASLLAHSVGPTRSHQLIGDSARRLGLASFDFDPEQAALIFEDLASERGALGVAARFAKARLMLLFVG
jgi:hypothetical protein